MPENLLLVVFHGRVFTHFSLTGILCVNLFILVDASVKLEVIE